LAHDLTGVTHVPGLMCYLCTRFVPSPLANKPFHLTAGLAPCGRSVRRR